MSQKLKTLKKPKIRILAAVPAIHTDHVVYREQVKQAVLKNIEARAHFLFSKRPSTVASPFSNSCHQTLRRICYSCLRLNEIAKATCKQNLMDTSLPSLSQPQQNENASHQNNHRRYQVLKYEAYTVNQFFRKQRI